MSQRECAGFNWPPLSIPAVEPVSSSPEAVNRTGPSSVTHPARFACLGNWSNRSDPSDLGAMSAPLSFQSLVVVVTQPAIVATCGSATATFRPSGVWPVALRPSKLCDPPELPTVGVGHPAKAASAGNAPPAWFGPPFDPSVARGVFHAVSSAKSIRSLDRSGFSARFACPPPEPSELCGVGHPLNFASSTRQAQPCFVPCKSFCVSERPDVSWACGVVQPLRGNSEALPDVGRAEARRAGIDRPDGVALSFQVSLYKVEPSEAVLACNLLAKDDARSALFDEMKERGP